MTMTNSTRLTLPFASAPQMSSGAEPAVAPGQNAPPTADFLQALAQMFGSKLNQDTAHRTAAAIAAQSEGAAGEPIGERSEAGWLDPALMAALTPLPHALPLGVPSDAQAARGADPVALLGLAARADASVHTAIRHAFNEQARSIEALAQQAQHPGPGTLPGDAPAQRAATLEPAQHRSMHAPVGTRAWTDELGSQLMLMTDKGQHTASLRLTPEHLGPLEIRIALRDEQASVWFGAAHADTRAAIEQALPRLRELFAAQGMVLADAGVSDEAPKQGAFEYSSRSAAAPVEPGDAPTQGAASPVHTGLLDAYA